MRETVAPPGEGHPLIGDGPGQLDLTPELSAELLDPASWSTVRELYARTMKVAVALIDPQDNLVGPCHNPQPIWSLARNARPEWGRGCIFCLSGLASESGGCTAAADARNSDSLVMVHDMAGFVHIAAPLSLGQRHLGTLLAGQVLDRYPEGLGLRRVAREFGLSAQDWWHTAIQRAPISANNLMVHGELLRTFGQTFLRERYRAILER